ncbi:hypothetical protein ACET98_23505, partial [Aeromonas veronii]
GDGCHEAMSLKGTHHTSSTDRRHHLWDHVKVGGIANKRGMKQYQNLLAPVGAPVTGGMPMFGSLGRN